MAEPWLDLQSAIWTGVILGAGGGSLYGLLGALSGFLAPRGIGRAWILGGVATFLVLGVVLLGVGLTGLATGQPYHVWYPFTLSGGLFTLLASIHLPLLRRVYAQAEQRRLQAEGLRQS